MKKPFDKKYVNPVGKSVPRIDGLGMVTGQTKYAFDVSFSQFHPDVLPGLRTCICPSPSLDSNDVSWDFHLRGP